MQRTRVDLPEPDGPHRTIFSPARTDRLMSDKAWKLPNHFSTPCMTIIGWVALLVDGWSVWLVMSWAPCRALEFVMPGQARP